MPQLLHLWGAQNNPLPPLCKALVRLQFGEVMSLLEEIQAAAIDTQSDLGTILRKCKVLAARLGSQPLENWLLWESNSYPDDVNVPDYRTWPLQLNGHFAGYFGSGIQNAPIPLAVLPEN